MNNHRLTRILLGMIILTGCHTNFQIPLAATLQPLPSQTATVQSPPSQVAVLLTATPLPRITPTQPAAALILLKKMKEQYDEAHLQPGWIHLVAKQSWDGDITHTLSSANPGIDESYIHLNEDQKAFEGVFFTKTVDGQVVAMSILKDSQWYNPAEGTRRFTEFSKPDLYWMAVWNFERYISIGNKLDFQQTTFNNEPALLFSIQNSRYFPGGNLAPKSGRFRAYFSPEGKILQSETVYLRSDGSFRVASKAWDFVVEPDIEPPAEILELINKIEFK